MCVIGKNRLPSSADCSFSVCQMGAMGACSTQLQLQPLAGSRWCFSADLHDGWLFSFLRCGCPATLGLSADCRRQRLA